jgi:methylase of polypeptide subunit release factors
MHQRIAAIADTYAIVFEVGDDQAADVAQILRGTRYRNVTVTKDLAGVDRVVEGTR